LGVCGIPRKLGTVSRRFTDRARIKKTKLATTSFLLMEIQDIFEKPRVGAFAVYQ